MKNQTNERPSVFKKWLMFSPLAVTILTFLWSGTASAAGWWEMASSNSPT